MGLCVSKKASRINNINSSLQVSKERNSNNENLRAKTDISELEIHSSRNEKHASYDSKDMNWVGSLGAYHSMPTIFRSSYAQTAAKDSSTFTINKFPSFLEIKPGFLGEIKKYLRSSELSEDSLENIFFLKPINKLEISEKEKCKGFGNWKVYRGYENKLRKLILIKKLKLNHDDRERGATDFYMFLREREVLEILSEKACKYIKQIIGAYYKVKEKQLKAAYLVFCQGELSLDELKKERSRAKGLKSASGKINDQHTYSPDEAYRIFRHIGNALVALKESKIYHSNITPENIVYDSVNDCYQLVGFEYSYKVDGDMNPIKFYSELDGYYCDPYYSSPERMVYFMELMENFKGQKEPINKNDKKNNKLTNTSNNLEIPKANQYNSYKCDLWSLHKIILQLAPFPPEEIKRIFGGLNQPNWQDRLDTNCILLILDEMKLGIKELNPSGYLREEDIARRLLSSIDFYRRVGNYRREELDLNKELEVYEEHEALLKDGPNLIKKGKELVLALSHFNKAICYKKHFNLDSAETEFEKARTIFLYAFRTFHNSGVISCLREIADIYAEKEEYLSAKNILERVYVLEKELLGTEIHENIARTAFDLGLIWKKMDLLHVSIPHFEKALYIESQLYKENDLRTIETIFNLALCLFQVKRFGEARLLFEKLLKSDPWLLSEYKLTIQIHMLEIYSFYNQNEEAFNLIENILIETKTKNPINKELLASLYIRKAKIFNLNHQYYIADETLGEVFKILNEGSLSYFKAEVLKITIKVNQLEAFDKIEYYIEQLEKKANIAAKIKLLNDLFDYLDQFYRDAKKINEFQKILKKKSSLNLQSDSTTDEKLLFTDEQFSLDNF